MRIMDGEASVIARLSPANIAIGPFRRGSRPGSKMGTASHMPLLTLGAVCIALTLPSEVIHAQEFELQTIDRSIKAAATYCDGKALGRIDDQIYLSAEKWLDCMIVGQRCRHDAAAAEVDPRSSILSCTKGRFERDYETERGEFWRHHEELQTECVAAIGGPCGFSTELMSDDQIAKIPGSNLSSPDPLP